MSYKLFLDDMRQPEECAAYMYRRIGKENPVYLDKDWVVVKDYPSFENYILEHGCPTLVSFDHDLADDHYGFERASEEDWKEYYKDPEREKTGYDCALFLQSYCDILKIDIPRYYIHSMNPVGTANIQALLRS